MTAQGKLTRRAKGRRRQRATDLQSRAAIAPYLAELEHAKVPSVVVKQATKLIALLFK